MESQSKVALNGPLGTFCGEVVFELDTRRDRVSLMGVQGWRAFQEREKEWSMRPGHCCT